MLDLQKIEEISAGVDQHLLKLESFIGILKEIKLSLDEMRYSREEAYLYELQKVKTEIAVLTEQLQKQGMQPINKYEAELHELRLALEDAEWPEAVVTDSICNSDNKIQERAQNILDYFIPEPLENKKFLDYGCGNASTLEVARRKNASFAIGYDPYSNENGVEKDLGIIKSHGPYDVILVYDVLDHLENISPVEALKQVKKLLSTNGTIYLNNHPWCSRHGGHLYKAKNKAFMHMVFDEVELTRMGGYAPDCSTLHILKPLEEYRLWIAEADLEVVSEMVIRDKVEPFFLKNYVVNDKLKSHYPDKMIDHLEISFVEYVLRLPQSQKQTIW